MQERRNSSALAMELCLSSLTHQNDVKKDDLYASTLCLLSCVYVLLMISQSITRRFTKVAWEHDKWYQTYKILILFTVMFMTCYVRKCKYVFHPMKCYFANTMACYFMVQDLGDLDSLVWIVMCIFSYIHYQNHSISQYFLIVNKNLIDLCFIAIL